MKKVLSVGMTFFLLVALSGCKTIQNSSLENRSGANNKTSKSLIDKIEFTCVEPSPEIIPNGYTLKNVKSTWLDICNYHYESDGVLVISYINQSYADRLAEEKIYNPEAFEVIKEFEYLNNPGHILAGKKEFKQMWAEYKYRGGYLLAYSTKSDAETLIEILKKYSDLLNSKN